jgi:hypothetical protein
MDLFMRAVLVSRSCMPRFGNWRWRSFFGPARSVVSTMRALSDDRPPATIAGCKAVLDIGAIALLGELRPPAALGD